MEPFFYDEAEAVADHERRVRIEQEEARLEDRRKQRMQAYDRIRDYDPKQGGHYFTRLYFADFREFDIDEECNCVSTSTSRFLVILYSGRDREFVHTLVATVNSSMRISSRQ